MSLTSIEIYGYRGFSQAGRVRFAIPDGRVGSGLTVIVGPNNAGKTTVIEALNFLRFQGRQFNLKESQKPASTFGSLRITYEGKSTTQVLRADDLSRTTWSDEDRLIPTDGIFTLFPRRDLPSGFRVGSSTRSDHIKNVPDPSSREDTGSSQNITNRLVVILSRRGEAMHLFRRIFPEFPAIWLEPVAKNNNDDFYLKAEGRAGAHDAIGLGRGALGVLYLVDAILDAPENSTIAIDEPEVSLHPQAQRRLYTILRELSATRQIVVATHSPWLVPLDALDSGATIVRAFLGTETARLCQLSFETGLALQQLSRNRLSPLTLGLEARESFFLEDRLLLLEGVEDVAFYPDLLRECSVELPGSWLGWGVGGRDNMKTFAASFRELGFEKVCGILDSDAAAVAEELGAKFPTFKFLTIPAGDIRSKPARPAFPGKAGLLDEHGKVLEHLKEPARQVLQAAEQYLRS